MRANLRKAAEGKKKPSNWGKPSKEKLGKALKSMQDNPAATPPSDDGPAPDHSGARLTALRDKNQSGSSGKAQKVIKQRRV